MAGWRGQTSSRLLWNEDTARCAVEKMVWFSDCLCGGECGGDQEERPGTVTVGFVVVEEAFSDVDELVEDSLVEEPWEVEVEVRSDFDFESL